MKREKVRLDLLLVEEGLVETRSRARALIMEGKVEVDGVVVTKPGAQVVRGVPVRLKQPDHPYVSRGALKLVAALDAFSVDPAGKVCLDVGASTGGFTEVLLERGASLVYAVDVGRGQLAWKLRTDPRVVVMEGVNARYLEPGMFEDMPQLATVDVSFISLRLVVPAVMRVLEPGGQIICLVKPQFEAPRGWVGKGGVIRDEAVRNRVVEDAISALVGLGLDCVGRLTSPIRGQKGNLEELVLFRWKGGGA